MRPGRARPPVAAPAAAGAGTHAVPTLVEALDLLRGRCDAFLDLKPLPHFGPGTYADWTLRALARTGTPRHEVALLGEDPRPLRAASARVGALRTVPHLTPEARRRPGAWAISVEDTASPAEQLVAARPARALVWTVNDPGRMAALSRAGAYAIVTDRVGVLRRTLAAPRSASPAGARLA